MIVWTIAALLTLFRIGGGTIIRHNLFQNRFILRRPSVAIFADIVKILTIFTKAIFRDSKNMKNLEITFQNEICICIS